MNFDREKLAEHGLNISTASQFVRNRINRATASYYREEGDEYYIKVRYAPEFRQTLEDVQNILIYNSQGESVRVRDIAAIGETMRPPPSIVKTGKDCYRYMRGSKGAALVTLSKRQVNRLTKLTSRRKSW